MKAVLRIDGGARPTNPGRAGFACILRTDAGDEKAIARTLGWHTNNYAEYCGLIVGLKLALNFNIDDILVKTDSNLIVGHMLKGWRRNNDELRGLIQEAEVLLLRFPIWDIQWVKRADNAEADELCTQVILAAHANNPWLTKIKPRAVSTSITKK